MSTVEKRIGTAFSIDAVSTPTDPPARADSGITQDGLLEIDEKYPGPTWMQADFNRYMRRKNSRGGNSAEDMTAEVQALHQKIDRVAEMYREKQRKAAMDALFAEVDELETRTTREQRAAQAFARRVMGADYE